MKKIIALLLAVFLLCSCGAGETPTTPEEPETPELPEEEKPLYPIYTEEEIDSMTEEEFLAAAKGLGYTEEQLEYICAIMEEGLEREYVLMPLEKSKSVPAAGKTADGEKSIGVFYFDPEYFADYGGAIGFAYTINRGEFRILPEMPNFFSTFGILSEEHYVFSDSNEPSVRIYKFENTENPYATWDVPPEENTEYGYWNLGISTNKESEQIAAIYIDIPDDFDKIYESKEPDLSSTYQIAVIDTEGNEVYTIDTGINLMVEFGGLPDVVRPEIGAAEDKTFSFSLGGKEYKFDFGEGKLEKTAPTTNLGPYDEKVREACEFAEYVFLKQFEEILESDPNIVSWGIVDLRFSPEKTDLNISYYEDYEGYEAKMLAENVAVIEIITKIELSEDAPEGFGGGFGKTGTWHEGGGDEEGKYTDSFVLATFLPENRADYPGNEYRDEFGTDWYIVNYTPN